MLKTKILIKNKQLATAHLEGIADETLNVVIDEKVSKTAGEMLRDSMIKHSINATEAVAQANCTNNSRRGHTGSL